MATHVQDVWLGEEARLRGRRFAPYEGAPVRVILHPDLGTILDEPPVLAFLETLGGRVDLFAFEPRGHGGSAGRFGPEMPADLRGLLDTAPRRWPDGLPLVLAGHGLGGALALAAADHPLVRGAAALAPLLPPLPPPETLEPLRQRAAQPPAVQEIEALLASLDLARKVQGLRIPLLLIEAREDPLGNPAATRSLLGSHPTAACATVPGAHVTPLEPPWVHVLADWAVHVAAGR